MRLSLLTIGPRVSGRSGFAKLAAAVLALAAVAAMPAEAREIQLLCKNELATKPALWIFDTDNRNFYFDDGTRRPGTVTINESQITLRETAEQPICHVSKQAGGSNCVGGKQVTEFTTVINRKQGTYLVYCKNIHDDSNNWKPGQNCFPQGPNKGFCAKD
jgi:hypothetical protein